MTDQDMINAMQPGHTYYDPIFTLPGDWHADANQYGQITNLTFPGAGFTKDKNIALLVGVGVVALLILKR